ncbi:hypothetical protein [Kitasatospora viridis]|uniref:Uncharacterized protein n=1 Tax=Kitasatospora viridis TaxID=281105 RepID=A0A561SG56_9ACTN|nr:hypothetical protein [Kitasatospora viridis]TWF73787.1 hypothetical protein FHX73_15414 [Kitasatospora viridis]
MTDSEHEDGDAVPSELPALRLKLYIESLQVLMPEPQFKLLMDVLRGYIELGGGRVAVKLDDEERELFTPAVQRELLVLLGLLGALTPGHEERADRVVADLGDGEWAKEVMSLVPPEVAADPTRLREMRDRLDAAAGRRASDRAAVEEIARASGMAVTEED